MSEEKNTDVIASQDDYKYGFHDDNVKTDRRNCSSDFRVEK